jgi:hypothetical protein
LLDVTEVEMPVAVLVAVTLAATITAPEESVTVPPMSPVTVCAHRAALKNPTATHIVISLLISLCIAFLQNRRHCHLKSAIRLIQTVCKDGQGRAGNFFETTRRSA